MFLKRKRSSPSFSSSETITIPSSSPLHGFYHQTKPTEALYQKPTWSFPNYSDSDDALGVHNPSGRTTKRHRDDRPAASQVFASTMQRLYAAQRERPNAEPVLSQPTYIQQQQQQPAQPATFFPGTSIHQQHLLQKSTLHSFWRLPGQDRLVPPSTMDMAMVNSGAADAMDVDLGLRCEDCERSLRSADSMDLDDGMVEQETSCRACSRHVCDTCAVLGTDRICLACASGGSR